MNNQQEADVSRDFVDVSMNRTTLLRLLVEEPRSARSVAEELAMSRSTVHRVTQKLGEKGLIAKSDEKFEVTTLGKVVAEEMGELQTKLETAQRLEPFLNTLDDSRVDVPIAEFDDAKVIAPGSRQAHVGVKRIIELIEQTESVQMFSSILSPLYVDVAHREIIDGTDIEVLFDREIIDIIVKKYKEEAQEAFETGRFHVLVGDQIPFELFLFDDRVGMAAHDDSGMARAFIESSSPGACEWAEEMYRTYADDAHSFDLS